MPKLHILFWIKVVVLFIACNAVTKEVSETILPPIAEILPKTLSIHEHDRIDNYYWLNERENPKVKEYLIKENEYTAAVLSHTKDFQVELYSEIIGRIKQTDMSVSFKLDDYYYYSRQEEGKDYSIYCRKKGTMDAAEEIILDVNEIAKQYDYCGVWGRALSYDHSILAYELDTTGSFFSTIHFKDLNTGEMINDYIPEVSGFDWANDNKTIFYSTIDHSKRPYKIFKHVIGTDHKNDELIYHEKDSTFNVHVYKTKSKKYLIIGSESTLSSEYRYLDAGNPDSELKILQKREKDHEYSIFHYADKFYILTNWNAKNFRLMETSVDATGRENWKEIIPHREDVLIEDIEIFNNHLVVEERKEGLLKLRIINWNDKQEHYLNFGEDTYMSFIHFNPEFNTNIVRYGYNSLTTPNSVFDYNMETRGKTLLKQQEVLGSFDANDYKAERLFAKAKDGTMVPISLVYKKGIKKDGNNPLYLTGYGSYGASSDPYFSILRLSLLNRGFIYAIAHIRGGQELGRDWYENGKLFHKKNTFTDFIACAEHLINEKYTSNDNLVIEGGSAGGLLMGAVVNMRPDLFKGMVMAVPFVDVVTTMLDPDIPLTTGEYDEWGDPNKKDYYDYILSYSPYDNIEKKDYPHILVTTGINDANVQYWEPAKWVAKMRTMKTDNNRLLLKTNMDAGHGGASGRYQRYKEAAFEYTFILDLFGMAKM